ncbi:hypothetical protein JYB87_16455 [Shewanella avicenniae]|uniref:Uncharacterized protein n=1 Tax=Shewanella avicenniae TaxID=2814294 RepID=A0ABX7QQM9_9GAMM|nr:hypothetical protein [Shewanella avicenniae]QSX33295.1 hypothetical protein JYB87_16455 [Shewanella avicenniae]
MNKLLQLSVAVMAMVWSLVLPVKAEPLLLDADDVIAITQQLEQRPLAAEAHELRQQLFEWTRDSDAVLISVCDILGPLPSRQELPYGKELLVQSFFGNAAFQLQHPDSKQDVFKTQMAGVSSMLRAYANIIKEDDGAHIAEYDHWLTLLNAGTLAKALRADIASKCMPDSSDANQFAYRF